MEIGVWFWTHPFNVIKANMNPKNKICLAFPNTKKTYKNTSLFVD